MRGFPLLVSILALALFGCSGKTPEQHLAEKEYCERYAQEETARALGSSMSYQESQTYRVFYDTCMHKDVGERHFDSPPPVKDQNNFQ